MLAHIDTVRPVDRRIQFFFSFDCHSREDLLQRAGPCFQRLVHGQRRVSIRETALGHFPDQGIGDGKLSHLSVRHFRHDASEARRERIPGIQVVLQLHAQPVAEGHLADGGHDAFAVQRVRGYDPSRLDIFKEFAVQILCLGIIRQIVRILVDSQKDQFIACFFQLRRDDRLIAGHVHREGHQRGRHVDIVEGTGHAVLAADGRQAEAQLRAVRAQQSREGLAPAVRIFRHPAEILLECETDLPIVAAGSHDPGHRFQHCVDCAVVRGPAGQVRIEPVAHHGHGVGLSFQHRQLRHHGLGLGELVFPAVGHEYAARADGAVKHLHQAFLGAYVQVFQRVQPRLPHVAHFSSLKIFLRLGGHIHRHSRLLMGSVGIQERAGDIDDLFSSPFQHQPGGLGHFRHAYGLQVLFLGVPHELVHIRGVHHHGHTLLGLGDGDLRPVQSRVFLRYFIQIHHQAVRQLSDGH